MRRFPESSWILPSPMRRIKQFSGVLSSVWVGMGGVERQDYSTLTLSKPPLSYSHSRHFLKVPFIIH